MSLADRERNGRLVKHTATPSEIADLFGIIVGLHDVSTSESAGALGWAPGLPAEKAADAVSTS